MTTWSKATLRLSGAALAQNEVDQWFGRAPRVFRHTNRNGRNQWSLDSDLSSSAPLAKHITDLTEFVRALMEAFTDPARRFEADVYCSFASENGQGGFVVEPSDMAILARAGITLQVAFYPSPDAGDAEHDLDRSIPSSGRKPHSAWRETLCRQFDLVGFVSRIAEEVTPYRFGIKCRCPLHRGDDLSFVVDRRRNRWHCFGECGQGGDAVKLLALLYTITEDEAQERIMQMVQEKDE